MYGELTDKETVARVEYALEHQQHDQFEILLYKKNSEYMGLTRKVCFLCSMWRRFTLLMNRCEMDLSRFGLTSFRICKDGICLETLHMLLGTSISHESLLKAANDEV